MIYYNEWDKYPAEWLRNLAAAGEIPMGVVDERSIEDVQAGDVRGFQQAHFFAGIGGWPLALKLAGWDESWPVWTGSCPCQPFSVSGFEQGESDKRHLWPAFRRLISECRPPVIFGEQVASPLGRRWLAGVRADLEDLGYAVGAADLSAAGVAAPQKRQRLFWVADTDGRKPWNGQVQRGWQHGQQPEDREPCFWYPHDAIRCNDGRLRCIEPGSLVLGDGVPSRLAKIRAYGNAIVPEVATEFVMAYMEARG